MILKLDPSSGKDFIDLPRISIDGLFSLKPSTIFVDTSVVFKLSNPDISTVVVNDVPEPDAGIVKP